MATLPPWIDTKFYLADGVTPNAGGKLFTYINGTSTKKTTYVSESGAANTNPIVLNAAGGCDLWLGAGGYKVVNAPSTDTDPPAAAIDTWDNINLADATGLEYGVVASVVALKALNEGAFETVQLLGYYSANGVGSGVYYWSAASTAADNGGTVISPSVSDGTGRWILIQNEPVKISQFGARNVTSNEDSPALIAAYGSFAGSDGTLIIDVDVILGSNITIPANVSLVLLKGATLTGPYTLTINGPFDCGLFNCFGSDVTVVFGYSLTVLPQWWGAKGDGTTADTVSTQSAVVAAEGVGGAVYFTPTKNSYVLSRLNIATGGIRIFGDHTKIKQVYDTTANPGSGGAGSTKVSPVFFCKKTSSQIEITGFHFTTDDTTYPSITVPEWASYLAPICINRSDYVNVHHNTFAGNKDRAIFLYGGNYCRVQNNIFINSSMIMHIGISENTNFWDATTSSTTVYGPTAPIITDNQFIGYTWTNNCLFLSGPDHFTVANNKFIGFNNAASTPINLYVNDLGMFNGSGTAQTSQNGHVYGNTISGTFLSALTILGQAGGATESLLTFMMRYKVYGNTIKGTGIGVTLERTYELSLTDNHITTTSTPLYIKREFTDCKVNDNYLECTTESVAAASIDSTIVFNTNAVPIRSEMIGNTIICPAADKYLLQTFTGVLLRDFTFKNNNCKYNSTVATNRCVEINHTGVLEFSENKFYVNSSTITDRHVCVINKTVATWAAAQGYNPGFTVIPVVPNAFQYMVTSAVGDSAGVEPTWPTTIGSTVVDNQVTWTCQDLRATSIVNENRVIYASVRNRGIEVNANSVDFSNNIGFQQVLLSGSDIYCAGNRIESWTGSTVINLIVENATHVHVTGNYIYRSFSLNTPVLSLDTVVNSKIISNYISGNSSGSIARATVSGRLEHFGNTIINAGSGGAGFSITSAATARSMTQDSKGSNVTAANDLSLGFNGTHFEVDGSTTINGIATAGWQSGQFITLQFVNVPLIKHDTAPSAGFARIKLSYNLDYTPTAGDILTLGYDGTYWQEKARKSTLSGIGYATGAGGVVTQITSITTGVTLNKVCGTITTVSSTLLTMTAATFILTNSTIEATDVIKASIKSYGGTAGGIPVVHVSATAAGSCTLTIHNIGTVTLDAVIVISFSVSKAVAA